MFSDLVARIRHVKCDEKKPACMRCVSSGRTCEGYEEPQSISLESLNSRTPPELSQILTIRQVPPAITGDDAEYRSLSYFKSIVVPEISGFFDLEFWNNFVIEVSQTEPAVRHALLALSSTFEENKTKRHTIVAYGSEKSKSHTRINNSPQNLSKFASQHYTKAIKTLVKAEDPSPHVTLVTCLVFVCLEYLRNNFDVGLAHLKSGLKILADAGKAGHPWIEQPISELFARLDIQATIHGSATSDFTNRVPIQSWSSKLLFRDSFSNLQDARTALVDECGAVVHFIRHQKDPEFITLLNAQHQSDGVEAQDISFVLESRRALHFQNLENWDFMLKSYLQLTGTPIEPHIAILQLWHLFTTCQLTCAFFSSELLYDDLDIVFTRIVTLASFILGDRAPTPTFTSLAQPKPSLNTSFDVGVLAPLFFTVMKCRHLPTRLRAIELIKSGPEREGMWRRDSIVKYAEWKVAEEEKGRGLLGIESPLPEAARITGEMATDGEVDGQKVRIFKLQRGSFWEEMVADWSATMGDFL